MIFSHSMDLIQGNCDQVLWLKKSYIVTGRKSSENFWRQLFRTSKNLVVHIGMTKQTRITMVVLAKSVVVRCSRRLGSI